MTPMETIVHAQDEALRALNEKREEYVRAWIAETGLHPTECELVQEGESRADGSFVIVNRVRRKGT